MCRGIKTNIPSWNLFVRYNLVDIDCQVNQDSEDGMRNEKNVILLTLFFVNSKESIGVLTNY